MQTINWKVEGMSCSNCALTIGKQLEKNGLQNIKVSFAGGDVSFDGQPGIDFKDVKKGIENLGYTVISNPNENHSRKSYSKNLRYLLFCLPFTLVLMLHMLHSWLPLHWLMNEWLQLILCVPVYVTGMLFFGKSAINSIRNGMPNMNVLVVLGASAAFFYSLAGSLLHLGSSYLFYETAAAIITLIFLGNYLEERAIAATQKALNGLVRSQKVTASMIAYDEHHQELVFPVDSMQLKSGDLLLIKSGEQVPADCKILWGEAIVNESLLTGESLPIAKKIKEKLLGGSVLTDGTVKVQVLADAGDSVLSNIIRMVKQAQGEKPPMQLLADKISAVFVPVVIVIALATLGINYLVLQDLTVSLMRSIAVLVIACPCAMGLATPAAIAVGLGRAARNGILFRDAKSLEQFRNIRQVVFDKTGTLTTGDFTINDFGMTEKGKLIFAGDENLFRQLVYSVEKYSAHPIAKAIASQWKSKKENRWLKVEEKKGLGMVAFEDETVEYRVGSRKISPSVQAVKGHDVYIFRNEELLGWVDIKDTIRKEAFDVIRHLKSKGIKTILLSGDSYPKCRQVADELGIDEVFAEQSPEDKLQKIESLNAIVPTAMVGDGINDAPALAKATIGISLAEASQLAIQTAAVVLLHHGLNKLPTALGLGRKTYTTIQQNLFWAFFYNIIAIPVAAFGLLTPVVAAFTMAFSDVILAINSTLLFTRKVD